MTVTHEMPVESHRRPRLRLPRTQRQKSRDVARAAEEAAWTTYEAAKKEHGPENNTVQRLLFDYMKLADPCR